MLSEEALRVGGHLVDVILTIDVTIDVVPTPTFTSKKKRRPRAIVKRRVSQRGDDRSCSRISSLSRLACAGGRYGIQLARGVIVAKTIAIGGKGHLAVSLGNRALATTRGDETFFVRGNTLAVRSDNDANIVRNDKAIANGNNTV